MAETQGPLTTLNNVLPSGLDATRLAQWQLNSGRTYADVRSEVAGALNGLNQELLAAWGDMIYVTTEDYMEYPDGGTVTDMPDLSELDSADIYKGSTVGHMIDLKAKGRGIGGSWRFFRDAREAQILATIRDVLTSGRNTFEKAVLTRAMTDTANLLGSIGYDLPFCNASSGVTYTPPAVGGSTFASSHTHYVGVATGTGVDLGTVLNTLAGHLQEHGHPPPYNAKVAVADVATYNGLGKFSKPISDRIILVDRAGATTGSEFYERGTVETPQGSGAGYYIGSYVSSYGEIFLYATARIPTKWSLVYKSYGTNNAKNPIAVRVHPDQGFGFFINEVASDNDKFPVAKIQIEIEYGVSCGMDRTAGAAGYLISGGAWANPTIS